MRYLIILLFFASCSTDSEYFSKRDLRGVWFGNTEYGSIELDFGINRCDFTIYKADTLSYHVKYDFVENKGHLHFENNTSTFDLYEGETGLIQIKYGSYTLIKTN